jgi:hypothetical protein
LCDVYLDEIFVDEETVVLRPKKGSNAFYIIMLGSIDSYKNDQQTQTYLNLLNRNKDNNKPEEKIEGVNLCLDDQILELENDDTHLLAKAVLTLEKTIGYGEYFGCKLNI